jgi:hypothetical protein
MDKTTDDKEGLEVMLLPEHKNQLRRRVEVRLDEMDAAVARLGGDATHQDRVRTIEAALQAGRGSVSGGWGLVGQMEAAQLAHWLETTKYLAATGQDGITASSGDPP